MICHDSEKVADTIRRENPNYICVKSLEDGSVACLVDLLFTRSIILGCDTDGWTTRYCFEDRYKADEEFEGLVSENDIPEGYTAKRGRS